MKIYVKKVVELGIIKYIPACDNSKIICDLLRSKTLNLRDISLIKKLDIQVELITLEPKEL